MPNESRHPGEGAAAGNDVLGNVVPSLDPAKEQVIARYANIPLELMQFNSWVCWKYVYQMGAKPKKIPLNPRDGSYANHSEPATWGTFDQAVSAYRDYDCDGIGFVLSDNDPYTFIDLDDCDGNPDCEARRDKIVSMFDSYTERSPSGRGFHVIVRGRVASGRRRDKVEIYSTHRFMTMTGDVVRGGGQ